MRSDRRSAVIGRGGRGAVKTLSAPVYANNLGLSNLAMYWDYRLGVTTDGSAVTDWTEQIASESTYSDYTSRSGYSHHPTTDGSKITFTPDYASVDAQYLHLTGGPNVYASGHSVLAVVSTTSTRSASSHTQNPPTVIVGESTVNTFNNFGFTNGALEYRRFSGGWGSSSAGSGYNDGAVRLVGYAHNSSDEVKLFQGGSQVGSTFTSVTYNGTYMGISNIGGGYRAETTTPDLYGSDDGWLGDIYAILVFSAEVSGADHTTVHGWSQTEFGAV